MIKSIQNIQGCKQAGMGPGKLAGGNNSSVVAANSLSRLERGAPLGCVMRKLVQSVCFYRECQASPGYRDGANN